MRQSAKYAAIAYSRFSDMPSYQSLRSSCFGHHSRIWNGLMQHVMSAPSLHILCRCL